MRKRQAHASSVLKIVDSPDPTKADEVELLKGYALAYSKLVKTLDAIKEIKPSSDGNDAKPEKQ